MAAVTGSRALWIGTAGIVVAFATFVLVVSTFLGLFVDHPISGEEPPLFNPSYEFAHTGRLTFPVYAFWYGADMFKEFALHPPTHYLLVGFALRLGDGIRLAEALPILVTIAVALVLLTTSRLSAASKIAGAFSLIAASSFALAYFPDSSFGARPELHVAVTWFAGLIALEGGRRRGWQVAWLFAGSLLLTLASTMQWFASIVWVGAAAYAIAAIRDLGFVRARRVLIALTAGVLLVGVPYVAFYIIPDWNIISVVRKTGWSGGLLSLWRYNLTIYAWLRGVVSPSIHTSSRWTTAIPALALLTRIPPFCIATGLLLVRRETRLLAFAALPLFVWTFFFTLEKGYYFIPEILFVTFAAVSILVAAIERAARALAGTWLALVTLACTAGFLGWAAWAGTPSLAQLTFKYGPLPTPLEVDRAAGMAIVGPNALVTSQHQLWYMSGARYWHDFTPDVLANYSTDPMTYFRRFGYVADIPILFFSPSALHQDPRATVVFAEYAAKNLYLRGIVGDTWSYGYTIFSAKPGPIRAFVRYGQNMYEFHSGGSGKDILGTFECRLGAIDGTPAASSPYVATDASGNPSLIVPIAEAYAKLPGPGPLTKAQPTSPGALHFIEAVIANRSSYASETKVYRSHGCVTRDQVMGTLADINPYRLGQERAPRTEVVSIYQTADEAVRAAHGA